VLNTLYGRSASYLWCPILILLLLQTAHGRNLSSPDLLEAGRQAVAIGNYKEAEDDFRQVINHSAATSADMVLALAELSNLLLAESRTNEAEPMLNRAIEMVRSNPMLNQRQLPLLQGALGSLYRRTGRV